MANIRTLKLNLLADVSGFEKGIKKASGSSESFAKKLGRNFALAGAAIGGAAIAFGVDAVKAFAEDERSQRRLSVAIKNTTKATAKQRKGVEDFIDATQRQYGVVDDELRPAFQRLVQATKSVHKSQELMKVVLDASAASGKSVETVALAISKAYGGNSASLGRLGLGLDSATLKSKNFNLIMKELTKITGGQAKAAANSLDGQMARFKITMDEAKESIGGSIVKGLQPLADKWLPKITGGITTFVDTMTGNGGYNEAVKNGTTYAYDLAEKTKKFFKLLNDNKELLKTVGTFVASIFIGAKAGAAVSLMVSALQTLRGAFYKTATSAGMAAGAEAAATGGASLLAALPAITAIGVTFGLPALIDMWTKKSKSTFNADYQNYVNSGGPVTVTRYGANDQPRETYGGGSLKTKVYNGLTYYWDPVKKKWYTRDLSGGYDYSVQPPGGSPRRFQARNSSMAGNGITIINLNGIVDGESARRSIQKVLQDSSIRTGPVNLIGNPI